MMWEMIVGCVPFFSKHKKKSLEIYFPSTDKNPIYWSNEVKDLITKLLSKDPKKRLGRQGGADEILAHPFFASLDTAKLERIELDPPYKPKSQNW